MRYFKNLGLLALLAAAFPSQVFAQAKIPPASGSGGLTNPLGDVHTIEQLITLILQAMVRIGIPIAVLFLVIAGFMFVTAQGSEEKLKKAKTMLLWTVVGIFVLIGAELIARVIEATVNSLR